MTKKFHIVAISGSLRSRSTNTELLHAVAAVAEETANVVVYEDIGRLPHFNPDVDVQGSHVPDEVSELRALIAASDAILIASPEYAHGVPGSLKNALDWLVSGPEIVGKPAGLLNASERAVHAHKALEEILRTMSANLVDDAVATIPLDGRRLDAGAIAANDSFRTAIQHVVVALMIAVRMLHQFRTVRQPSDGTVLYRRAG